VEGAEALRALYVPAPSGPLTDPLEVDPLLAQARQARFNTVIVQVITAGEAYYASSIVPLADSILPKYTDPLGAILEKAKGAEADPPLRVIVAVELLRAHSTEIRTRPRPGTILAVHPEWVTLDRENKAVGPDNYLTLEPALEPVRSYLDSVVRELVTNYDIDGVYFVDLRYPGFSAEFGYHPLALQQFKAEYPSAPERPEPTNAEWIEFRQNNLATLLSELKQAVKGTRVGTQVYAQAEVVNPPPDSLEAWNDHPVPAGVLQDWVAWDRRQLADWICVKNPQTQDQEGQPFRTWTNFAASAVSNASIAIGIVGKLNFNTGIANQIRIVQNNGLGGVILFDSQQLTADDRDQLLAYLGRSLFSRTRNVVKLMNIQYLPPVTPTPEPTELTTPTTALVFPDREPVEQAGETLEEMFSEEQETTPTLEVAEPEPTATPEPEPTPSLLLATPSPVTRPMQTFRLRNGMSFKGRIVVEIEGKVSILTEEGTTLNIPREQIVSPSLE
jgi:uncharacterized lipoprotein YddW (UPF0748 family)